MIITWIFPEGMKEQYGAVTKVAADKSYLIIKQNVVLLASSFNNMLPAVSLGQQCKYVAIGSDQKIDNVSYLDRVVKIDTDLTINEQIDMKNRELSSFKSDDRCDKKVALIHNNSMQKVKLLSLKLEPENQKFMMMKPLSSGYTLYPVRGRKFTVHFNIFPRETGTSEFTLKAFFCAEDGRNFTKECKITVIVKEIHENFIPPPRSNFQGRFSDNKRTKYSYDAPALLRDMLNRKCSEEELLKVYPKLREEISPANYLPRMTTVLHLERVSLEIAFRDYRQEKVHFEVTDSGLFKLKVKNLAEKRPSICIGDKLEVRYSVADQDSVVRLGVF